MLKLHLDIQEPAREKERALWSCGSAEAREVTMVRQMRSL
jgi:hypothetical protein